MTRRTLRRWIAATIVVYATLIVLALYFRAGQHDPFSIYAFLKDFQAPIVALPAAWLAWCFQRRNAYLTDVRALWSRVVEAIQGVVQYTHAESPSQQEFGAMMKELSVVIDEVRGSVRFTRSGLSAKGAHPFPELLKVRDHVKSLGFGPNYRSDRRKVVRDHVTAEWMNIGRRFLPELGRERWDDADRRVELVSSKSNEAKRLPMDAAT